MVRSTLFLLLCPLLLLTCKEPSAGTDASTPLTDSIWDGELQFTGQDARFLVCGSSIRYILMGSGLDTVQKLYDSQRSVRGQRMKAWLSGHLEEQHPGQHDTAFIVSRIEHIDATLSCPPRPRAALAGRYSVTIADPMRNREVVLYLQPEGEALMTTSISDTKAPMEQDGTWGVASNGTLDIHWRQLDLHSTYTVTENTLTLFMPKSASGEQSPLVLTRTGPTERAPGTQGQVLAWLAAVSANHGVKFNTDTLSKATPLSDLFRTPEAAGTLRDSAITWLPLRPDQLRTDWPAVSTIGDLIALKRLGDQRGP